MTPQRPRSSPPAPLRPRSADPAATRPGGPILALAFDLDGTVYLGDRLLPGAAELLEALSVAGVAFVFATNNSSKTLAAYRRHLAAMGLPDAPEVVLTSNDVARDALRAAGVARPFLVATDDVRREYGERGLAHEEAEPDAVLLTFDTSLTYAKLRRAADLIRAGVPYFATHPDRVCPTPEGPIPDCGAFAALLAAATGAQPVVLGKPERPMAEAIGRRLGASPSSIAFVGDRLYTDVRMANDHGFVAVLTLTGETTREDLAASEHRPDIVVGDLRDLHTHLREVGALA